MKKKTKRLLSSLTAGLFVLQSIPFMTIGSSAVGDTALKYTPTIDGQLDAAYLESYSLDLNTSSAVFPLGGSTELSAPSGTSYYLWDNDYLYMAAQIHDETISTDSTADAVWQDGVVFSFFNSSDGNGSWRFERDARIRISPTANQINVSNRNGTGAGTNLPETNEQVFTSLADYANECAYTIDKDNNIYTVELRVKMDTLTKGDFYQLDFSIMDKYGNNGEDSRIYGIYSWAAPSDGVFSLGEAYESGEVTPPVQVGGNGAAVKGYTATIDGEMDEAYTNSYCYTIEKGNMKLLWDKDYVYMYATIDDTSFGTDDYIVEFALLNSSEFWSDSDVYRFMPKDGTAQIFYNWRNGGTNIADGANGTLENTEYVIVKSESGVVIEGRILRSDALGLSEGKSFKTGLGIKSQEHAGWADNTVIAGCTWQMVNSDGGDTITLGAGEQPPVDDTPVVKKSTPVLDGKIDDAYLDSFGVNTLELAKEGKLVQNWATDLGSYNVETAKALLEAGIVAKDSTAILSDGNFDIPEFTHSQSYFLWDDDALYMCSKIYDSTLMTLDDEQTAAIVGDSPWLVDGIMHMLYVSESTASENYFFVQSPAGGNAIWENDQTRWSTLGDFVRDSAEKRLEDAQNIATTLNTDEGYYILEMRVPLTETAKETLLKDGQRFGYNFMLVDSFGGWATNCGSKYRINYQVEDPLSFKLSSEAASTEHTWAENYTIDKAATCSEAGSESIHCIHCDAIKEDSVREIPMLEHSWNEEYTVDKEATCTEAGSESIHCSVCGAIKEDSVREIPMTVHSWNEEYTVDKEATCTEAGSESIHCSVCGAIKEDSVREIEKIPHNFVDGICTVCGEKEQTGIIGDVNGDGEADARDLSALMKILAEDSGDLAGDVNGDGSVDARDLSALMKILAEQE